MKKSTHWVAFGFCAFLSLMALVLTVAMPNSSAWQPAFFASLPMCFFYIGATTAQMHRELGALQERLNALEQVRA